MMEFTPMWNNDQYFNSDFGHENLYSSNSGKDVYSDDLPVPTATSAEMMNTYRGGGENYTHSDGHEEVHDIYSGDLARRTMPRSRSHDRAVTPIHAYQYAAEVATMAEEFFAAGGRGVANTPNKSREDCAAPLRTVSHYASQDSRMGEMDLYDCPITVAHVQWLMKSSNINEDIPITSLKQCSPSFFVLLFQRLLPNQNIEDLEMEPNTQEKRLHNIQRVLERLLDKNGADESYISATEIVNLNEEHISRLIRVFLMLALRKIKLSELQAYKMLTHTPKEKLRKLVKAESAVSTEQLISNWKKEIVPPVRDLGHLPVYCNHLAYHPDNYHPDHENISYTQYGSNQHADYKKGSEPLTPTKLNGTDTVKRHVFHIDHLLETPPGKGNIPVYKGSHSRHKNFFLGKENAMDGRTGRRNTYKDPYYRPVPYPSTGERHVSADGQSGDPKATDVIPTKGRRERQKRLDDHISVRKPRRDDQFPKSGANVIDSARIRPSSSKRKDRRTASSSTGRRLVIPPASFPSETYHIMKSIDTDARDFKIEQLRTMRFIKDTQMTMRAELVRQASQRNAQIATETKEIAKRRQRDIRDLQKLIKDEESRYLQAYGCILMSARNEIEKNQLLVDPKTVQLYRKHLLQEKEAVAELKQYELAQEAMIDSKVNRYLSILGRWRHGTIAY